MLEERATAALRNLRILSPLPRVALDELAASSLYFDYLCHEEVVWQADKHMILGVLHGEVDISLLSAAGRALPIMLVAGGGLVDAGPDGWTGGEAAHAAILSRHASVCLIPRDALEPVLRSCLGALRLWALEQERWSREVLGLASDRLHLCPDVRIQRVLWRDSQHAPPHGMRHFQWRLAARACTDQPRVSKLVGRLSREEIVDVDRKKHLLRVRHPERLRLQ